MSHMLPGLCRDCHRRISHDSPTRHGFYVPASISGCPRCHPVDNAFAIPSVCRRTDVDTPPLCLRVRVHHYKRRDPCISHKLTSLSSVWRKLFVRVTLRLGLVTVRYASRWHHCEWDGNSTDYRCRGRISV